MRFDAHSGLLVNATMICVFACRRLDQKDNEEAMPTARDHGRRDLFSPTTIGSSTICWILHTSTYRNTVRFSHHCHLLTKYFPPFEGNYTYHLHLIFVCTLWLCIKQTKHSRIDWQLICKYFHISKFVSEITWKESKWPSSPPLFPLSHHLA